jgi:polar amino acid transport system substrate-binding protein
MDQIERIKAELAPTGVLRAGINMGNHLLVTGCATNGEPVGVSPSLAHSIAEALGVPVQLVPFARPGELADAVDENAWDIALIGAEPQRAEKIAFTAPYADIQATYMVPFGSPITEFIHVDRPGNRIAVAARAAYDLWLELHIHQAMLIRGANHDAAFEQFKDQKLEVLAGLRSQLLSDIKKMPGARILDGQFTAVHQAVGCSRRSSAAAAFLADFIEKAKSSGLILRFIEEHQVHGLSVAAPA